MGKMQEDSPADSGGFRWIPADSGGFRRIPEDSGEFRRIPVYALASQSVRSGGFRRILADSGGFRRIPADSLYSYIGPYLGYTLLKSSL